MIVTGARKGIGRHVASYYLERGYQVNGCSRQSSPLEHPHYVHYELDVHDEIAVKKMFGAIRRTRGRLDALINNAGVASMNHALLTPLGTVERLMKTNFGGTFLFCREAVKLMQRQRFGRIVNMSTVAVPLQVEGESVYAASKAARGHLHQSPGARGGRTGHHRKHHRGRRRWTPTSPEKFLVTRSSRWWSARPFRGWQSSPTS